MDGGLTPQERAAELLTFYKNYRFYIAEMDCRNMAANEVKEILSVLEEFQPVTNDKCNYYREVMSELQIVKR
jgi:hypothetical protein